MSESGRLAERRYDVIVCGAGSAGAALAGMAAHEGLSVLVLERRTLDRAGAYWINDVPGWMFDEAGVARGDESEQHASARVAMIAGFEPGAPRIVAQPRDFLGIDMRALVARLQETAMRAGAELRGGVHVHAIEETDAGVEVQTSTGRHQARFLVDATGLAGLEALGKLHHAPTDVCAAAQEVRRVRDAKGAEAFFARHDARDADVLVFTGIAGGYSIVNVRRYGDRVYLLTGSIPADGHPSGKQLLDRFVEDEPWIGDKLFGGSRAIPLVYPRPIVSRGRLAALGDAASQVFSAHGSGVGAGLVAARMLTDALSAGDLTRYQHRWQKRWGFLFAAHDLFRRFSQSLSSEEVRALIGEGILSSRTVEAALAQRFPGPDASLWRAARALARRPTLARRLATMGAATARLATIYATHPREPDKQEAWAARVHAAMQ